MVHIIEQLFSHKKARHEIKLKPENKCCGCSESHDFGMLATCVCDLQYVSMWSTYGHH